MKKLVAVVSLLLFIQQYNLSQTDNFTIEEYSNFLNSNKNMTYSQLEQMYSAGLFLSKTVNPPADPLYLDSIKIKYNLTNYEFELINKHGFMVTERGDNVPFAQHFLNIWQRDLPVFISTDAILYGFHLSFDRIFKEVEIYSIIPTLKALLAEMYSNFGNLEAQYSSIP